MSYSTALSLVQAACYSANIPAPSTLIGVTDTYNLQLRQLFYDTGIELRNSAYWPQMKRDYYFILESGREFYPAPTDMYSPLPRTFWDQQNRWEMLGPQTDIMYNYRKYGYVTIENRKAFQIFGPDINPNSTRGNIRINPIPGASAAGWAVTCEYMSKTWLLPPNWAPSTAYTTANYVNVNGNIYRCVINGSSGSTFPPTVSWNCQGQDGGVFWTAITVNAWLTATPYSIGDYVSNGGNVYKCTVQGVSSGGPSGTGDSITDGTVTWEYVTVNSWTAQTEFAFNDVILTGGRYYVCSTPTDFNAGPRISGDTAPNWYFNSTDFRQEDGTAVWQFVKTPYDTLVSDSDLVVFDPELMTLGLKWRFMRARGLQYEDIQSEYNAMRERARSRFNPGRKLSMGAGGIGIWINVPEGNFGNTN